MKMEQGGDRYQLMSEINMVPLIDVALVLLIIFMVMTPILVASQIKMVLPGSQTGDQSQTEKPVDIQIEKSGVIHLMGKVVPVESLREKIEAAVGPSPKQTVLISADKDVPIEKVVAVMDATRLAKVQKMSIGVRKVQSSGR